MFGRPELKIKPWKTFKKDLEEGNQRVKWIDRIPYAYWKGNPGVGLERNELLKCNLTDRHDWRALIYDLVTISSLSRYKIMQSLNRYKINFSPFIFLKKNHFDPSNFRYKYESQF